MPAIDIRVDDLRGGAIIELLQLHLRSVALHSPPESIHALDLSACAVGHHLLERMAGIGASGMRRAQGARCFARRDQVDAHGAPASRKGVATALLRHIIDEAKRRRYRRLSLETGSAAAFAPARTLYAKHGFIAAAHLPTTSKTRTVFSCHETSESRRGIAMPARRRAARNTRQAIELALAVPQVVAHRVGRAAGAGPFPSLRDRREFQRMGTEKIAAFYESWNAMVIEMARANMRLSCSPLWWSNPWKAMAPGSRTASMHARTALDILYRGASPYHRRAVANARRLTRSVERNPDSGARLPESRPARRFARVRCRSSMRHRHRSTAMGG